MNLQVAEALEKVSPISNTRSGLSWLCSGGQIFPGREWRRESPTWATQVDPPKSLAETVDCRQLSAKVMFFPQQCAEAILNHPPEHNISFHCESLTLAVQFRPLWTSWASSHGPWLKILNFLWKSKPEEEIVVRGRDPKIFLEDFMASLMVVAEKSSD